MFQDRNEQPVSLLLESLVALGRLSCVHHAGPARTQHDQHASRDNVHHAGPARTQHDQHASRSNVHHAGPARTQHAQHASRDNVHHAGRLSCVHHAGPARTQHDQHASRSNVHHAGPARTQHAQKKYIKDANHPDSMPSMTSMHHANEMRTTQTVRTVCGTRACSVACDPFWFTRSIGITGSILIYKIHFGLQDPSGLQDPFMFTGSIDVYRIHLGSQDIGVQHWRLACRAPASSSLIC